MIEMKCNDETIGEDGALETPISISPFSKKSIEPTQKITTMSSAPPYALEIDPESSLQFTITRDPPSTSSSDNGGESAGASRCTMTLRHTGKTNENLAFKVSFNVVEFSQYYENILYLFEFVLRGVIVRVDM